MRYKLILFDFDGTLADTLSWFLGAFNEVAAELHLKPIQPESLETLRNSNTVGLLKELGIPLWRVPQIARRMRAMMARDIAHMKLFPEMPEVLESLHRSGASLGMVTSNSLANVEAVLGKHTMSWLRYVECGASILGKTSRLKSILRRSGVPAAEIIFVGDEARDIEAANAAGVASGAVLWGYHSETLLLSRRPSELFKTPAQLLRHLS